MVFAAIDWSGAKARGGARDIALAEAADERLVDIRVGLSRTDVERWLLRRAASARELVVGLDFAFSLPAWFAREKLSAISVDDVWAIVEAEGEQWLDGSAPWPFWGRGERPDSTRLPADRALRHTDRDVAVLTGAQPKSVYQLVGSGQVGPGSIRGMPMLRRLRAQGFAVWPFDAFPLPCSSRSTRACSPGTSSRATRSHDSTTCHCLGMSDRARQRRPRPASMRSTPHAQRWRWLARPR